MIAARVRRCRRIPDADAPTKQEGHAESPTAHVLNFSDLIHNLPESIVDEIDEHEIDDRPATGHRGTARESNEAALSDRRVTETLVTILGEQTRGCGEVATPRTDAFAHDEDARRASSLSIQPPQGSRSKSNLPVSWGWFRNLQRRGFFAVDIPGRVAAI